jgi:hypothetical protein
MKNKSNLTYYDDGTTIMWLPKLKSKEKSKCSAIGCKNPAEVCVCIGIRKGKPKVAYTNQLEDVEQVIKAKDCAIPLCSAHKMRMGKTLIKLNQ